MSTSRTSEEARIARLLAGTEQELEEAIDAIDALFRGEVAAFDYWRYYTGLVNMRGAEVGVAQAEAFMIPRISRKPCLDFFPLDKPMLIF